jgi:hypothetical protein
VNKNIFEALKRIPLSIAKDDQKFVYTETESLVLYVDKTRQYYSTTNKEELNKCKSVKAGLYICKQSQPLLNSHLRQSCVVKFQPRVNYTSKL